VIHVVEVKTRRGRFQNIPEQLVSAKKIKMLITASEEFMYQNPQYRQIQFDVLAVMLHGKNIEYLMIEDVYEWS